MRLYSLDWQRASVCWGVLLVHTIEGAIWHYPKRYLPTGTLNSLKGVQLQLQQIGMPMLFISAGRTFAASRSSTSIRDFLFRKSRRLLIPFFVGYLFFVLPAALLEIKFRKCMKGANWFQNILDLVRCTGPWWLWFLPALYCLLAINFFLLRFLREIDPGEPSRPSRLTTFLAVAPPACLGFVLYLALPLHESTLFFYICPFVIIVFGAPVLLKHWPRWGLTFLRLLFPFFSVLIGTAQHRNFSLIEKRKILEKQHYSVLISQLYYTYFMAQGLVEHLARKILADRRQESLTEMSFFHDITFLDGKWWVPFLCFLVPVFSTAMPTSRKDFVYQWAFPPYYYSVPSVYYIIGTWSFWLWYEMVMSKILNRKFMDFIYKHSTDSAFIIYMAHGLGVSMVNQLIPLLAEYMSVFGVLLVNGTLALGFSLFVYVLAINVPCCRMLFALPPPQHQKHAREMQAEEFETKRLTDSAFAGG